MTYKRILVPVDGSATSTAGLNEALRLARNQNAKLKLIHVVDELSDLQLERGGPQYRAGHRSR